MASPERRRVHFPAPGQAEVLVEAASSPGPGEVRVRTEYSAISPGTERLVYEGNVPSSLAADPSIEALQGEDLSYPLSYGYACAGKVEELGPGVDETWRNTHVFSFQPHVSRFVTSPDELIQLPEAASLEDAVMIPSLETAVNLVMDGRPMLGERVLVFGQGIVGLLTIRLLTDYPLDTLVAIDPSESRRERSDSMGVLAVADVSELALVTGLEGTSTDSSASSSDDKLADLVFELSGQPSTLNDAIHCTGFDGRIVVGSWYGTKTNSLDLGGHFHRSRMQIISSQVSTVDPSLRGRWSKSRRMSTVLDLLETVKPAEFISDWFDVDQAPSVYESLASDQPMLQPVFTYD